MDTAKAAADSARILIAEINEQMPRTLGNAFVPFDRIDAFVHTDRPLIEHVDAPETEVDARIGELIAGLVEDGSTLQMGIGSIPNAVLARLHDKRDLGVHTEMFSDGVIDLVERGVINGRKKRVHPGVLVSSFLMGTRRLYDFVDDNPQVVMLGADYVNDTRSSIVDAPSTMVVNGTQLKVYAWYDNEMGYAHRLVDVALMVREAS